MAFNKVRKRLDYKRSGFGLTITKYTRFSKLSDRHAHQRVRLCVVIHPKHISIQADRVKRHTSRMTRKNGMEKKCKTTTKLDKINVYTLTICA